MNERQAMGNDSKERKECFGLIQEVVAEDTMTMIEATFGCRECGDFRECLQLAKEKNELKKQNMIAKIIDLSEVLSNEIGACLLECLSRIYNSPLGTALFNSLLLFYEIPQDGPSHVLSIPISPAVMDLIGGDEGKVPREGFILRIILLQRFFPGQRKANMGLIAHEVARAFSSDDQGAKQVLEALSKPEAVKFKKMDPRLRVGYLIKHWGFQGEYEAFVKETEASKTRTEK
jgi:hypothetical protein